MARLLMEVTMDTEVLDGALRCVSMLGLVGALGCDGGARDALGWIQRNSGFV